MGMVDIHCHLLPGVDDGAKDWETTLEMCRMAQQDGVSHIVCTPHANHEYNYDREAHQALLDELRARFSGLEFSLGCDFHLSYENISDAIKHPGRYAIGSTRYLLVELSEYSVFNVGNTLFELQTAGMTPIITHPERHPQLQRKPETVGDFCARGCLVQITANSLTGAWGKVAQKACEQLLKMGCVHFIASDAHGLKSRPTILSAARKAAASIVGETVARALLKENPAAVVCNRPVLSY
jgi:protein-tyrosine phosphatase